MPPPKTRPNFCFIIGENLWILSINFFIINKNNLVKFMSKIRKKHSKEFKFKVAIEAIKEQKTTAMICKEFCVCESQVNAWKK